LVAIFNTVTQSAEFIKSRGRKTILPSAYIADKEVFIHRNIHLTEDTTLQEYLDITDKYVKKFYDSGYAVSEYEKIVVKMWILNSGHKISNGNTNNFGRRGYHTTCVNSNELDSNYKMCPLNEKETLKGNRICTMDIETIDINGNQTPIAISFAYTLRAKIKTIFNLIDPQLLIKNPDEAVNHLWQSFYKELLSQDKRSKFIIYSHNLGRFDGFFIYKGLLQLPDINISDVSSIIDLEKSFIGITAILGNTNLVWKDSIRLFPLSLNELCKMFEVKGKLSAYNKDFSNIDLFNKPQLLQEFKEYSIQDSVSLL